MTTGRKRLGILMGGGTAPGINSAISAVTIEAINSGAEVIGIYDGFEQIMKGRTDKIRNLTIEDVSRIHFQGGSIIRTSRANPTRNEGDLQRTVQALHDLSISYLVTIGGDDTAFSASEVAKAAGGLLRTAHIPKTIDNDLPLPDNMPTFGYETARHLGVELVRNLMEDSRTTNRWYFVTTMGRKAGHLALGIGKAAGATLTIIPEEFPSKRISLGAVGDVLETAILKRRATGQQRGLAIIAEGVAEKMDPEELAQMPGVGVAYDQHGHLRLDEVPLEKILKLEIQRRFEERGERIAIVDRTIGYELRSAPPIPFDIDYTRTLGYGAAKMLLDESDCRLPNEGGLICLKDGRLEALPFDELRDPTTGRTRVRMVDIKGESYHVAREYMIRLEKADLDDPKMREDLAQSANMTVEQFMNRFASVVDLAGAVR